MNLLFVCSENRLRSPTAEAVFSYYRGVNALGAGVNPAAARTVSRDLIEWADRVFVMEAFHRELLLKKYPDLLDDRRLVCLNIPDRFAYMDPELVELLESGVSEYLRPD
ncbi:MULTISPECIES: phosphotyrosine protein phosphatase [unclassified Microbulbifer]|uniref:low molecular weight protein tyrosine phosphatase family protein n=1 Tax=unclassified Microbulbifer TaxID=2619833 RepID=UPI0027E49E94|nr:MULTISPECIES: phosphotyrosine protein phosphatase [unclassified Microbulbifer]